MESKGHMAGDAINAVSLTIGKALALSFGIAIAMAAVLVGAAVLVSQ